MSVRIARIGAVIGKRCFDASCFRRLECFVEKLLCVAVEEVLAAEVVNTLEENKITALLVTDDDNRLIGALNIHDLFRAGIM